MLVQLSGMFPALQVGVAERGSISPGDGPGTLEILFITAIKARLATAEYEA